MVAIIETILENGPDQKVITVEKRKALEREVLVVVKILGLKELDQRIHHIHALSEMNNNS